MTTKCNYHLARCAQVDEQYGLIHSLHTYGLVKVLVRMRCHPGLAESAAAFYLSSYIQVVLCLAPPTSQAPLGTDTDNKTTYFD